MKKGLVYDLPTRLFHWLFSSLFISAFAIAKLIDDESVVYTYHMLLGLMLGFLVLLRVAWGIWGTQYALFRHFKWDPKELFQYFWGIFKGLEKHWAGHNPASSWAALVMMGCALGSVTTGVLMGAGLAKEDMEDIHELFANGFALTALAHVLGIAIHTLRFRDGIGWSMVHGRKAAIKREETISNSYGAVAVLGFLLVIGFGVYLVRHYEAGTLHLWGVHLTLGKSE